MIQRIREAIVDVALAELYRPVLDTVPNERIEKYHRDVGGSWDTEYTGQAWCGMFVAWCAMQVGDFVEPGQCVDVAMKTAVARICLPSTYRLSDDDHWHRARVIPPLKVDVEDTRRGDIVVTGREKHYGDHITLALSPPNGDGLETVSGNVHGRIPGLDGVREGVALKTYSPEDVAVVYRLVTEHFRGSWI